MTAVVYISPLSLTGARWRAGEKAGLPVAAGFRYPLVVHHVEDVKFQTCRSFGDFLLGVATVAS